MIGRDTDGLGRSLRTRMGDPSERMTLAHVVAEAFRRYFGHELIDSVGLRRPTGRQCDAWFRDVLIANSDRTSRECVHESAA